VNQVIEKLSSPESEKELYVKLSENGITSNYGLRDNFIKIVKIKYNENLEKEQAQRNTVFNEQNANISGMEIDEQTIAANKLKENLEKVRNSEQLLHLIRSYPFSLKVNDEKFIDTALLHNIMKLLLDDKRKVNSIAKKLKNINNIPEITAELEGLGITPNYGLQDSFIKIVKVMHRENLSKQSKKRPKPVTSNISAVKRKVDEREQNQNKYKHYSKSKPSH
jgi:hypothetical protein